MKKQQVLTLVFMVIFLILLLILVVQLYPLIKEVIANVDDESVIVDYIYAHGTSGVPILMGLSALTVIIPIIPGPAVGILTGLCYGVLWGPLIFLVGSAFGHLFIFVSIRQLRGMSTPQIKDSSKYKSFLSKEQLARIKKPEMVVFFCCMIPGLPGGVIPYVFAGSKVSLVKYMAAMLLGSVPFALLYVFLGDRISQGSYTVAIVMAVILVAVILIFLPFRKKIIDKIINETNV